MTPADEPGFDALPLSAVLRVNARCDAFEADCRAGRRPRADDSLGDSTASAPQCWTTTASRPRWRG